MRELTLQLALKSEYFEAIKSGTKIEEFRLANPYWTNRLHYRNGKPVAFDALVLTSGYPKRGDPERTIRLPWRGFSRRTITHPHFGPEAVDVFAIKLTEGGDA